MKRALAVQFSVVFLLAGCVTLPAYDARIDDGLTNMSKAAHEHYAGLVEPSDQKVCSKKSSMDFWRSLSRDLTLLRYRAALLSRYETFTSRLDAMEEILNRYRDDELAYIDRAVSQNVTSCPPAPLAMVYQNRLSAAISSLHRIALKYEKKGS
jgi:hypothetical protein